ncbi:MAG: hypothetical protein AAF468_20305 [Pseudomonadota bacterium]
MLTHQEKFGAFLVSGRRGSGKTSFVEYVLAEYDADAFQRFIRLARNATGADFLVATLLGLFFSVIAVLASQLVELLVQQILVSGHSRLLSDSLSFAWLPILLIAVLCVGFLRFASAGIEALFVFNRGRIERTAKWFQMLLALALIVAWILAFVALDFLNSYSILQIVVLSIIVYSTYFVLKFTFDWWSNSLKRLGIVAVNLLKLVYTATIFRVVISLFVLFFAVPYIGLLWASLEVQQNFIQLPVNSARFFLLVCLGGILAAGVIRLILHGFETWTHHRHPERTPPVWNMSFAMQTAIILKSSFLFILIFSVLAPALTLVSQFIIFAPDQAQGAPGALATWVGANLYTPETPVHFSLDGWDAIIIFLFLGFVFAAEYRWLGLRTIHERNDGSLTMLGLGDKVPGLRRLWPEDDPGKPNPSKKALRWMENGWGNPLNHPVKGKSHPYMERADIVRRLEKASLVHAFFRFRLPVIQAWINLGFDNINHSDIIEAMLVQLRARYKAVFLDLTSGIGLSIRLVAAMAILILTKFASVALFHVGHISANEPRDIPLIVTNGKPVEGSADYCRFFKANPDIAPSVTGAACLLPFSNSVLSFLYTPIFHLSPSFVTLERIETKNGSHYRLMQIAKSTVNDGQICYSKPLDSANEPKSSGSGNKQAENSRADVENAPRLCARNDLSINSHPPLLLRVLLDYNLGLPILVTGAGSTVGDCLSSMIGCAQPLPTRAHHPAVHKSDGQILQKREQINGLPTFRVYHLLLFALMGVAWRQFNLYSSLLPYRARYQEMTRMIQLIRGRVTYSSLDLPNAGWLERILGLRRRDETIESNPDPRIVELSFLDLLGKTTRNEPSDKSRFWTWVESKPEIVFVFDELDKLTGKADAESARTEQVESAQEENTQERKRSQQLHQLLSDMKRILSSESARFIFVGSRLYHDEWLADQANRSPILSSIFNGEVYLPSLLTDREHPYGKLSDRLAEFFILMFRNARHRYYHWSRIRTLSAFSGTKDMLPATYIRARLPHSGHPRRLSAFAHYVGLRVLDESAKIYSFADGRSKYPPTLSAAVENTDELGLSEQETLEQFLSFLTYRSAGNPKKLKELLQELVVPAALAFGLPRRKFRDQRRYLDGLNNTISECHDVIRLDDKAIYRVQFIDMLYRHLCDHMEGRMLERDDKVAMSVFYLMDFLLKFHNRGFSRTNLQRVDELSHIHRAPDLRSMMGLLVDVSSERFLHRVLNGVYTFRFRSDFAREIDYVSRISKGEMAALNFTLDESQSLKGVYEQTIQTGQRDNVDTIAGLGELYEYDQDFEIARNFYRRAISVLDQGYSQAVGAGFTVSSQSKWTLDLARKQASLTEPDTIAGTWMPMGLSMVDDENNREQIESVVKANFPWAIARLRLMLQIGHTYEQERNLERALAAYMHSHRFSRAILAATRIDTDMMDGSGPLDVNRSITGEGFSIIYQGAMAAAWILEKDSLQIDDSIVHAELALGRLYRQFRILFPHSWFKLTKDLTHFSAENTGMLLTASDIHGKVGDLYFFKGKQALRGVTDIEQYRQEQYRVGYLLQAHHHYALSIWNIRYFLALRQHQSTARLNILNGESRDVDVSHVHPKDVERAAEAQTLAADGAVPDRIYESLSDTITSMSEAILARTAIGSLLERLASLQTATPAPNTDIEGELNNFGEELSENIDKFLKHLPALRLGELTDQKSGGEIDLSEMDPLAQFQLFGTRDGQFASLFGVEFTAGPAHLWLGEPRAYSNSSSGTPIKEFSTTRSLHFRGLVEQHERLFAQIFFSNVAAKNYLQGGYSTDAAGEYLLQAETIISVLWAIRQVNWLNANANEKTTDLIKDIVKFYEGEARKPNTAKISDGIDIVGDLSVFENAQCALGAIALRALRKAVHLIQISHRPSATRMGHNHGDPEKIRISSQSMTDDYELSQLWRDDPRPLTLAASLVLAIARPSGASNGEDRLVDQLAATVYDSFLLPHGAGLFGKRGDKNWEFQDCRKTFSGLYRTLERYRYPILNRLNGLKILADAAIIHGVDILDERSFDQVESEESGELDRKRDAEHAALIGRFTKELVATAGIFDSEMHFPPFRLGTTLALAHAYCKENQYWTLYDTASGNEEDEKKVQQFQNPSATRDWNNPPTLSAALITRESLGEYALNFLRRAEQMHSMGKAYYDNIAHLHYLNDDYNDRILHYNHAQQMMFSELTHILAGYVHSETFPDRAGE